MVDAFDFLERSKVYLNGHIEMLGMQEAGKDVDPQDLADVLDRLGVAVSALEMAPLRRCPECIGDLGTHPGELILVVLADECPLDKERRRHIVIIDPEEGQP